MENGQWLVINKPLTMPRPWNGGRTRPERFVNGSQALPLQAFGMDFGNGTDGQRPQDAITRQEARQGLLFLVLGSCVYTAHENAALGY